MPLVSGRFFTDFDTAQNARAGGDHRREVRAALLAERERDRQACLERSEAAVEDRRRGRHGEAVRPRHRRPHRRLSPDRRAAAVSGRADGVGPSRGRVGDRARDSRDRSDHPGLRRPHDARSHAGFAGAAALLDDHAGRLRGVRADPGGGRRLRRDVVPGDAGHARHRRPHGARRAGAARCWDWCCGRDWS